MWPFVTGFVSLAEYRYHNAAAGWFALQSIARTGFDQALGRNPEVISGRLYKPLDTAVPQQFFATSMVLTPLIRGLLGLEVDAPAHRVTIAPHLPPGWNRVEVSRVPVGAGTISVAIARSAGRISASITRAGDTSPLEITFSPALPIGARAGAGTVVRETAGDLHVSVTAMVAASAELSVSFTGGWSVEPPAMPAIIGHRSEAPRVLSERIEGGRYVLRLEGLAGRAYDFHVRAPDAAAARAMTSQPSAGATVAATGTTATPRRRLRWAVLRQERHHRSDDRVAVAHDHVRRLMPVGL